jgi:hypothetical protein
MMFPPRKHKKEEAAATIMDNTMADPTKRKILILLLFFFFIFGCTTIPKGPLKPDEVRLTDLKIVETGDKMGNGKLYKAIIGYQHGEKTGPGDITSACTSWSWLWET